MEIFSAVVPTQVPGWKFTVQCPVETFTLIRAEHNAHLFSLHTIITFYGGKKDF